MCFDTTVLNSVLIVNIANKSTRPHGCTPCAYSINSFLYLIVNLFVVSAQTHVVTFDVVLTVHRR